MGIAQLVPRVLLGFLSWSAAQAFRIERLNTSLQTKDNCGRIMIIAMYLSTAVLLYDACSLSGSIVSTELLVGSGLRMGYIRLHMQFLIFIVIVESFHTLLQLSNVLETRGAAVLLSRLRCDVVAVVEDLKTLTFPCTPCCPSPSVNPFTGSITGFISGESSQARLVAFNGTAHRLSAGPAEPTQVIHV